MVGYIVQKGDSLWKIAKENHTTVDNLREITALRRMRSPGAEAADCQECAAAVAGTLHSKSALPGFFLMEESGIYGKSA